MPTVIKDFVAKIAIGIQGVAVLEVSETLTEDSPCKGNEVPDNLILLDMENCGIEDWADHHLSDVPVEAGVFTFSGRARFTEDDSDYSMTCDQL